MDKFYLYKCEICGFSREKPGLCPFDTSSLVEFNIENLTEQSPEEKEAALEIWRHRRSYT